MKFWREAEGEGGRAGGHCLRDEELLEALDRPVASGGHLRTCPRCQARREGLARDLAVIGQVLRYTEEPRQAHSGRLARPALPVLATQLGAAAAAAVLIAGIGLAVHQRSPSERRPAAMDESVAHLEQVSAMLFGGASPGGSEPAAEVGSCEEALVPFECVRQTDSEMSPGDLPVERKG